MRYTYEGIHIDFVKLWTWRWRQMQELLRVGLSPRGHSCPCLPAVRSLEQSHVRRLTANKRVRKYCKAYDNLVQRVIRDSRVPHAAVIVLTPAEHGGWPVYVMMSNTSEVPTHN